MILEELKVEADKLGYNLVKKPEKVTLLPCPICGKKRTHEWYAVDVGSRFRRCSECDFTGGYGKTRGEARRKWNKAVLEYEKEAKNDN